MRRGRSARTFDRHIVRGRVDAYQLEVVRLANDVVCHSALLEEIEPTHATCVPPIWSTRMDHEAAGRGVGPPVRAFDYLCRSFACEQREALPGAGLSPFVAVLLVGLDQMFREPTIVETTSMVEDLTGGSSLVDRQHQRISSLSSPFSGRQESKHRSQARRLPSWPTGAISRNGGGDQVIPRRKLLNRPIDIIDYPIHNDHLVRDVAIVEKKWRHDAEILAWRRFDRM